MPLDSKETKTGWEDHKKSEIENYDVTNKHMANSGECCYFL